MSEQTQPSYAGLNRIDVITSLHSKGHSKQEIEQKLETLELDKDAWQGSFIGLAFIVLAVVLLATGREVNPFEFKFTSKGDIFRFNEWVMKPFIAFNFIVLGIQLVKNRERFPFKLKMFYIVTLVVHGFLSAINNSVLGILLALTGVVLLVFVKEQSRKAAADAKVDLNDLGKNDFDKMHAMILRNVPYDHIQDILLFNSWRGSALFVLYLLATILFFSDTISIQHGFDDTLPRFVTPIMGLVVLSTFATGICSAFNAKLISKKICLALLALYGLTLTFLAVTFGFQIAEVILIGLLIMTGWYYKMNSTTVSRT